MVVLRAVGGVAGQGKRLVSIGLGLALLFIALVSVTDQARGEELVRGVLAVGPGYSFVSLPCVNNSFTASSLLDALGDAAKSISYYDTLTQSHVTYDRNLARFGVQDDFPIQPDTGYIVYSIDSCGLSIEGIDAATRSIHLLRGYNLVGWSSPAKSDPVTAFIDRSNGLVESVSTFDRSTQQFMTYDKNLAKLGVLQPDFDVTQSEAYFVYSRDECVLDYASIERSTTSKKSTTLSMNAILLYDDFPWRGDPQFQVTVEIARPLVAHLDTSGNPTDWLFDTFILYNLYLYFTHEPTQDLCRDWINYLFGEYSPNPINQLANLNEVVGQLKIELGKPDYRLKVYIAAPLARTDERAGNWDQLRANINSILGKWKNLNPQHLELDGFYWGLTEEKWTMSHPELWNQLCSYLHSLSYKAIICPFCDAMGIEEMHDRGFDYVFNQPNYAWKSPPDASLFAIVNRNIEQGYVDGPEIETGFYTGNGVGWLENLRTYLHQGKNLGWDRLPKLWYHGSAISEMGRSSAADKRQAYQSIYDYAYRTGQSS